MWAAVVINKNLWPTYHSKDSFLLFPKFVFCMFFIYKPFSFFKKKKKKKKNFPTHILPENVCRRSINLCVTQIDMTRFGKFKAFANYSKVGKHTHMKHLFVGAWKLSGGLSCIKTSILTTLPSSPSLSGGPPEVLPPLPAPPCTSGILSQTQTNRALLSSRTLCYFH